jgi:hypothetical protein
VKRLMRGGEDRTEGQELGGGGQRALCT